MKLIYAYNNFLKDQSLRSTFEDINIFKEFYKMDADSWLIDRTGIFTLPWHTKLLDQCQFVEPGPAYDFSTACTNTAKMFLEKDQPLILMWSGGIDSTAMVTAFLQSTNDYSNITIAFNSDSIREYPLFYEKFICGKIKGMSTEELILRITTSGVGNSLLLSAEHADQLFGSPMVATIYRTMGPEFGSRPFNKENFSLLLSAKGLSVKAIDCWFDIYSATITKSPKPILTMFNFAWWHGFNFKWQVGAVKTFPRFNSDTNYTTFFSAADFQRWSINQNFAMEDMTSLKAIPKQFIFDFTNDHDYVNLKIKHPSSTLYYAKTAATLVTEDMTKFKEGQADIMEYYNPDNFIANWIKSRLT